MRTALYAAAVLTLGVFAAGTSARHAGAAEDGPILPGYWESTSSSSFGPQGKTERKCITARAINAYLTGPVGPCTTSKKGKKASASAKRKRSRHLWGDSHGNFRTVGKSSSASTRGTKWLTKDTCQGTITTVLRGKVLVRDFKTNGRHIVTAGHSFLAPLP